MDVFDDVVVGVDVFEEDAVALTDAVDVPELVTDPELDDDALALALALPLPELLADEVAVGLRDGDEELLSVTCVLDLTVPVAVFVFVLEGLAAAESERFTVGESVTESRPDALCAVETDPEKDADTLPLELPLPLAECDGDCDFTGDGDTDAVGVFECVTLRVDDDLTVRLLDEIADLERVGDVVVLCVLLVTTLRLGVWTALKLDDTLVDALAVNDGEAEALGLDDDDGVDEVHWELAGDGDSVCIVELPNVAVGTADGVDDGVASRLTDGV